MSTAQAESSSDLSKPQTVETVICGDEWEQPGTKEKRNLRIVHRREPGAPVGKYECEIEFLIERDVKKQTADGEVDAKIQSTRWQAFNPPIRSVMDSIVKALHIAGLTQGHTKGVSDERGRIVGLLEEAINNSTGDADPLRVLLAKVKSGDKAADSVAQTSQW